MTTAPPRTGDDTDAPSITEILGAEVRYATITDMPTAPTVDFRDAAGAGISAHPQHALLEIPGVARYSVRAGQEVSVQRATGARASEIDSYLHGTITALLLGQQGRFALHANTVSVRGTAVALTGRRGAGKTTTSLTLRRRGHELIGDDIVILDPTKDGILRITTNRPLHVEPDTGPELLIDLPAPTSLGPRVGKLAIALPIGFPGPLHGIVAVRSAPVAQVALRAVDGLARIRLVNQNAYRVGLARSLWPAELFRWAAVVASLTPAAVLLRPADRASHDDVATAIEAHVAGLRGDAG